mmetsp:Transcript_10334/g.46645  ORF Transcript_10334/g.46645 Transcript_10334/m.46645 type:complete len:540 (+) Transcript_10334:669-2288(+)
MAGNASSNGSISASRRGPAPSLAMIRQRGASECLARAELHSTAVRIAPTALVLVDSRRRIRRRSMSITGRSATSAATRHASTGNWTTPELASEKASSAEKIALSAGSGGGSRQADSFDTSLVASIPASSADRDGVSPAVTSANARSADRHVRSVRSRSNGGGGRSESADVDESSSSTEIESFSNSTSARPASTATSPRVAHVNSTSSAYSALEGPARGPAGGVSEALLSPSIPGVPVPTRGYANRATASTALSGLSGTFWIHATTAGPNPRSAAIATRPESSSTSLAASSASSAARHPPTPSAGKIPPFPFPFPPPAFRPPASSTDDKDERAAPNASATATRPRSFAARCPPISARRRALSAAAKGLSASAEIELVDSAEIDELVDNTLAATARRPSAAAATTASSSCDVASTRHSLAQAQTRLHASLTLPELCRTTSTSLRRENVRAGDSSPGGVSSPRATAASARVNATISSESNRVVPTKTRSTASAPAREPSHAARFLSAALSPTEPSASASAAPFFSSSPTGASSSSASRSGPA